MGKRIEDKIMDILGNVNEGVEWETIGGPTPSSTLKGPLDYAKNVKQATVPQAYKIPGVGEIGDDEADKNDPITDVVDGIDEDEILEDEIEEDEIEETFASLLARLAEEDEEDKDDGDDDEDDKDKDDLEEEDGEQSLKDDNGGEPDETLPDVDSELEHPEKLVSKAPGIKVAEGELKNYGAPVHPKNAPVYKSGPPNKYVNKAKPVKYSGPMHEDEIDEDEGETSLKGKNDNGGEPEETLPGTSIDSLTRDPDKLVTKAKGAKAPDEVVEEEDDDDEDNEKKKDEVAEDINAIFAGVKLSEQAKVKAAVVFKAAVARRVNEEKSRVQIVATRKLKEAFAVLKTRSEKKQVVFEGNLTGQVDRYLNYVVENWMGENRLAVENGIRAELAESFIGGLKALFVEHYIEVPETKVDVVATLGKKVTNLEAKLNEAIEGNVKMRSSLNTYRKEEVVRAVSGGLAETQRERLKGLAEGVEYTTRKEFASKLMTLKEHYFAKKATPVKSEEQPLMESVSNPNSEMSVYSKTLAKMNRE